MYYKLQAHAPDRGFDEEFLNRCRQLTKHHFNIDLHTDIRAENCVSVFKFLINCLAG